MSKAAFMGKVFKRSIELANRPFCSAIVAAAGTSTRMGEGDKLFAGLDGEPVLALALKALQESKYIDEIVVVTREESIVPVADICAEYDILKATKIIRGGETRLDSVLAGLAEASKKAKFIAIHDGARPLLTEEVIAGVMKAAWKHNAAAPAVPVNDTVKTAEKRIVTGTPDRKTLFSVQTPQVFRTEIIKGALQNAKEKGLSVTDDCSAVEALGAYVALSDGSFENIKITTPVDVVAAEAILLSRRKK